VGSQDIVDKRNVMHQVLAAYSTKQWWNSWGGSEEEEEGKGGVPLYELYQKESENIKSTQRRKFVRWWGKIYSYWSSCTHVSPKITAIALQLCCNLMASELTTITREVKKLITDSWMNEHEMCNRQVEAVIEEGKKRRLCEEISEELAS